MKKTYHYIGQRFQQRPESPEVVLFIAPAEDIDDWGGVPQKSSKFMKGFQRAEDPSRRASIGSFFEQPGNISPTAIVVAFKPNEVNVTDLQNLHGLEGEEGATSQFVRIEIEYDDLSTKSIEELASMVYEALSGKPMGSDIPVPRNEGLEGETVEDDDESYDDETEDDEELEVHESQLDQFLIFLRTPGLLNEARDEDENKLRSMLINLLKPGIIVDGQHRTRGAAFLEQNIPFPIVSLLNADWREQVFQFIIINQKAKPIPSEFLTAIISSSLSSDDIEQLKKRLDRSGISLEETSIMNLVNFNSQSPFRGMINFRVQGSKGTMGYPGMLALARRFRNLRTHDDKVKFRPFFQAVFESNCHGSNYAERRHDWLIEGVWFKFFSAFWSQVCAKYNEQWAPGSNLLKIVALQELQNLFLQWLFDRTEQVEGVDDFKEKADQFLTNIKAKFFDKDWKLTSLQSATGRKYLREALSAARKDPRYRYTDALFRGVTE